MVQDKKPKQTILITGATSYTGGFLIDLLLKKSSAHLVLTSRNPKNIKWRNHSRITCFQADLNNPASYQLVFDKNTVTDIIHLAAMARLGECELNPMEAIRVNYQGTLKLIQMAKENKVRSYIFTSSDLAQQATSVVGMCKYLIENEFRINDSIKTRFVTVRMPNIIDSPGTVTLLFKRQIKNGGPVTITHPNMSRRFITGSQAAAYIQFALNQGKNNQLYVNTEVAINICDLARQMMTVVDKPVPIKFIGMKPGENISEPGYQQENIMLCSMKGLGRINNNSFNENETKRILHQLLHLAQQANDTNLTQLLLHARNNL